MTNPLVDIWEKPAAGEMYMIAGWNQWADAGSISSGLPHYLIEQTGARKIGEIKTEGFYLFQIPGTHHFLRPEIKLEDGYRTELTVKKNEIFYAGNESKGLVIFAGDEPHLNVDKYAEALFDVAQELEVKRVGAVGGVFGSVPYNKDREVSCSYSLPTMKQELAEYVVRFSNYEGGVTIGSYLLDQAEQRELEYFVFYAFVPAYDFSQISSVTQSIRLDYDFRAWYELMRRFNHMFDLGLDLTDLAHQSDELIAAVTEKIEALDHSTPRLKVKEYLAKINAEFTERPFMPLSDVWAEELGDLLDDLED